MPREKDHTSQTFALAALVVLMLLGMGLIPPFRAGKAVVKRVNILSDLFETRDELPPAVTDRDLLDTSFLADLYPAAEGTSSPEAMEIIAPPQSPAPADKAVSAPEALPDTAYIRGDRIYIEDFSPGRTMTDRFYRALAYEAPERTVRIAVLGDSFIEGDIITADIREQLQLLYGGCGVGFVPFSSALSKYRGTIKHTFEGWREYSILKRKSVPEEYRDRFFVSGQLSVPDEGATVSYRGVSFRRRIERYPSARLLFVNRGTTEIGVTVNDSARYSFRPPSSSGIGQLTVGGDISKLDISLRGTSGFIGYGVVMEDTVGVSVHNFSVRGNSGLALFGTDGKVNSQIDSMLRYDMVILQYGLNAMSADVTDYSYYGRQLRRMISYIKECFPGSAIVVMSVGDRSTLKDGSAVTMPAVKAMLRAQREAAAAEQVSFWNTFEAMGGDNSMAEFVKRKWAAKDYTHIGYNGGKHIAGQFVKGLSAAVERITENDRRARAVVRMDAETMLAADSLFRTAVLPSLTAVPQLNEND